MPAGVSRAQPWLAAGSRPEEFSSGFRGARGVRQQKGRFGASPLAIRNPATRKVGTRRPRPPVPASPRALTAGSDPDLRGLSAIARRPLTPELPRRYLLGGAGRAGNLRGIWLKIQPPPTPLRARLLRLPDPARAANATGSFSLHYRAGRERATILPPPRGQAPPLSPAGHRAAGAPLKRGTCGQCDRRAPSCTALSPCLGRQGARSRPA